MKHRESSWTEAEFECKNGKRVCIEIDEDDDYKARVRALDGKEIGRLEFREIDDGRNTFLKLSWAYLDKAFRRQGIGRECLRLVSDPSCSGGGTPSMWPNRMILF